MLLSTLIGLIAITLIIHLFYQAFFLTGLIRIKTTKKPHSNFPGVSVIIAARNELRNLQSLVPKLLNQHYPEFEILIVNDRSEDESISYLLDLEQDPRIKPVFVDSLPEHINSKKYALTLGIKAARHNVLLFTDADCRPLSENWIREMIEAYGDQTKIVVGFSPYLKENGLLNALIRFETYLTGVQYLSSAANKMPYMGVGRNLSYLKEFFLEKKGFNGFREITGGDDDLFVNKNSTSSNTEVALSKECLTVSIPKKSWRDYMNQKIRHLSVGRHYQISDKFFLGFFQLSHILSWISMIVIFSFSLYPVIFGSIFVLGYLLLVLNFRILNKKSGISYSLIVMPFINIIYLFFYILVGIRTVFTKKVEWTN